MNKSDIESILVINNYLVCCELSHNFDKKELTRKYLTQKVKKTLSKRNVIEMNSSLFKVFYFLLIGLIR